MLAHRTRAKAAAAVIAPIIALLMVLAYQGTAAAQGQPPPAPQNPMAHLIAGYGQEPQVRVSWDAPTQGTAVSHTVSRNDGENFEVRSGATTHSDRTIVPGTAYSYTVTAENAAGSSPASAPATAQIPPAPSAPGNLAGAVAEPQATDETATVTLTWLASTAPEAASCETAYPLTGYTIVRSGGDRETELGTADAGATSFTDSAAAFSTDYTYRVIAQSAIGASPASETPGKRILATRAPTHGAQRIHRRPLRRQHLAVMDRAKRGSGHSPILGTPVPRARPLRGDRHTGHHDGDGPPDLRGGRHRRGRSHLLLPGHCPERVQRQPAVQRCRHRSARPGIRPDRRRRRRRD